MTEEEIPDHNVFMVCERLDESALAALPAGYSIRSCRPDELDVWKAFPFDTPGQVREYDGFMTRFFEDTYGRDKARFFENTLFVCDAAGRPVATCASWKAYGKFETIHWFKTLKSHEGKGLGRAVLSAVMKRFAPTDFPIYLHTQPGSFRAIKMYSDFGFSLIAGDVLVGNRKNELAATLPILRQFLPARDFGKLKMTEAPSSLLEALKGEEKVEF